MKKRLISIALAIVVFGVVCQSYPQDLYRDFSLNSCRTTVHESKGFIEVFSFLMPDFDKYKFDVPVIDNWGDPPVACEHPLVHCPNGECCMP